MAKFAAVSFKKIVVSMGGKIIKISCGAHIVSIVLFGKWTVPRKDGQFTCHDPVNNAKDGQTTPKQ